MDNIRDKFKKAIRTPEEKRIHFTNVFCMLGIATCVPYAIVYYVFGYSLLAAIVVGLIGVFGLSWYANKKKRYGIAKFVFLFTANVSIFLFTIVLSTKAGIPLLFISVFSAAALAYSFSEVKYILFHMVTALAMYLTILLLENNYYQPVIDIEPQAANIVYLVSFVSNMMIVLTCIYQLIRINADTEDSLRQNHERLKALVNAVPDLIFRLQNDGTFLDFNVEEEKELLIPPTQIIGNNVVNIFPADLAATMLKLIQQAIQSHKVFELEYELPLGTEVRNYEARFVRSGENEVTAFVRDITDKKRIENQLVRSEADMKAIFNSTNQAFLFLDRNYEILAFNSKASAMLVTMGFPSIEVGKNFLSDVVKDQPHTFVQDFAKSIDGRYVLREREFTLINGQSVYMNVEFIPAFDKKGNIYGVVLCSTNVTERKKYEREMRAAKEQAETAAQIKSDFLSNMSHEMRTPLNAVIGFTDLLLSENPQKSQLENLQAIKYSSENLLVLINDILDLAKIDAGKLTVEQIDFNLKNLLDQNLNLVRVKALDKGIKLYYSIDPSIPNYIVGDPVRLNQILLNLTSNAVKFTHRGFVSLTIDRIGQDDDNFKIRFSVKDTGIGISPEKHQTIFDSFTQADRNTTRKYGGTGLGLSITKKLIEIQGGNIQVDSKPGLGSEFIFELPFSISERQEELLEIEAVGSNRDRDLRGIRILMVEDNSFNQLVITQLFQKWNVELDKANNGVEGIEKLKHHEYDLVLMDLQMPEMDGFRTTMVIRDTESAVLNHGIPVIAISADAYHTTKEKAMEAGMNDFITKPFRQNELYNLLKKYVPEIRLKEGIGIGSIQLIEEEEREDLILPLPDESGNYEDPGELNLSYIHDNVSTDYFVIKEVLDHFVSSTKAGLDHLKEAVVKNDRVMIRQYAHKMKAGFASIGYLRTLKMLALIEKKSEGPTELGFLEKLLGIILSDFNKACESISKFSNH